jgi:hypothetical protein
MHDDARHRSTTGALSRGPRAQEKAMIAAAPERGAGKPTAVLRGAAAQRLFFRHVTLPQVSATVYGRASSSTFECSGG